MINSTDQGLLADIIPHCGIQNDADSTTNVILKSIHSFELNKEDSMRIIFAIWKVHPKVMDTKAADDNGQSVSIMDLALRAIVKACRDANRAIRLSS